jgi:Outer membrane protein beta-barrel domain
MKTLIATLFIMMSMHICMAQQRLTLKAGTSYSHADNYSSDFGKSLGFYLGIGVQDKITKDLGFNGDINFLDQLYSVENEKLSTQSLNIMFCVDLYPFGESTYITIGPEFGQTLGIKYAGEKTGTDKTYRFGYVAGIGHRINDKIDIEAKFVGAIDDQQQGFDYNIQAGFSYKIPL